MQTLWDIQQKSGLWKFLKQKNSFFLIGFIYENFIHGAVEQIPETDLCYRFNDSIRRTATSRHSSP